MELDFFPYNQPKFKGKITIPEDEKKYTKGYFNKNYYLENQDFKDIDIDIDKLMAGRNMDESTYTLDELKEYAKQLGIEKISGMSKVNLIKKIKMKLNLI